MRRLEAKQGLPMRELNPFLSATKNNTLWGVVFLCAIYSGDSKPREGLFAPPAFALTAHRSRNTSS